MTATPPVTEVAASGLHLLDPSPDGAVQRRAGAVARSGGFASTPVLNDTEAAAFREGDPDAVRAVYRAYSGLVFAIAHRILGDRQLAEEATQQAFVQAWRAAATFDPSRELGPWLATIVRRVAIDVHRRESRRTHESLDLVAPGHPGVITLPPAAESAYEAWEVRRAVAELSSEERDVVRLQHLDGLTQSEIAARLHIPIGTVKSRSARAYRHLAGRLGHLREEGTA